MIACLLPGCAGECADRHDVAPPTPIETALNPAAILLVTLDTTRADQYAVQDCRYMLIVSPPEGHMELLDLEGDLGSLTDVSAELSEVRDRSGLKVPGLVLR